MAVGGLVLADWSWLPGLGWLDLAGLGWLVSACGSLARGLPIHSESPILHFLTGSAYQASDLSIDCALCLLAKLMARVGNTGIPVYRCISTASINRKDAVTLPQIAHTLAFFSARRSMEV